MHLEGLGSCAELTTEHAEEAARSAAFMRTLLDWAAKVARPGQGGPKILMALARMARADWVEGTPYVEIKGNESETSIAILVDTEMTVREPLFPPTRMRVPIDEFTRAVRLAPQLIAPLRSGHRGEVLVLSLPNTPKEPVEKNNMHTHPTVRRMVVVRPEALRRDNNDD
jgi:hypothetical protein